MSPFFDAGIMWTSDQPPHLQKDSNEQVQCSDAARTFGACAQRIPVFSAGVAFRVNLLGYAVLQAYGAKPFQRPTKDWVWGFVLAPGW